MGPLLILLPIHLFYTTASSKVFNVPLSALSTPFSNENDDFLDDGDPLPNMTDMPDNRAPLIQTYEDTTGLQFRQPIEAVSVDHLRNAVWLRFHKDNEKAPMNLNMGENESKKADKRSYEQLPFSNSVSDAVTSRSPGTRLERSQQTARDARGDNFMRFGRSDGVKNDFMRFGRGGNDFIRFGRSPSQDFMRFGRSAGQDFMRFGRAPSEDFMRFGRSPSQDFMRFGRAGQDNFMRFGRAAHDNFMRFGRNSFKIPAHNNFMRYSRPDNFMRFGRTPEVTDNLMRFDKSVELSKDNNESKPGLVKNELKEAVKLIHEADKNADNENPVDKAIKVLFDKHQQQSSNDKGRSDELDTPDTDEFF